MKAVNLLINSFLPPELQQDDRQFTKKELNRLLSELAQRYPDKYAEILKNIGDTGRKYSYLQGETLGLDDLFPVFDKQTILDDMEIKLEKVNNILDPVKKKQIRMKILTDTTNKLHDLTIKNSILKKTSLGNSVLSGARGNPTQLRSMITTPGLYTDYKDEPIDVFVKHSFSEGLRPAEYLASTFGTRRSVISTKKCLEENTEVRMADGTRKAIKDIQVGDYVLGSDTQGNTFPTKVTNIFDQGMQEVYEYALALNSGNITTKNVVCTKNHKFLQRSLKNYKKYSSRKRRGKIKHVPIDTYHSFNVESASNLTKRGNAIVPALSSLDTGNKVENYAYFLGLMLGDGCCTQTLTKENKLFTRCKFSCADLLLLKNVRIYLDTLNLKIVKTSKSVTHYDYNITSKNYTPLDNNSIRQGKQGFVSNNTVGVKHIKKLKNEGLAGKYAYEKQLPTSISLWNNESILKLVAAYYECDGSSYTNNSGSVIVSFASTSEQLLKVLRSLLEDRFGIYAPALECVTKGNFGNNKENRKHPLFVLKYSSYSQVTKLIQYLLPHMLGVKKAKLQMQLENLKLTQNNPNPLYNLRSISEAYTAHCYDIEVEHKDHLFVLGNNLISSNSTADAGFLSKQMGISAADLIISEEDSGSSNGIKISTEDLNDVRGRVLAKQLGPYRPGTIVDKDVMSYMREMKTPFIYAKSPITSNTSSGLDAASIGIMPNGERPAIGMPVGYLATTSLGEPLSQSGLNAKHVAGASSGKDKAQFSGFDVINQFMQTPKQFPHKATVSEVMGNVERIEEAPQGGNYVTVDGEQHYTLPGMPLKVKVGQTVEPGEPLSEGLMDPKDIVRLRGLGEGRKYYVERLKQIYKDSGIPVSRINLEILARGALNHIVLHDNTDYPDLNMDEHIRYSDFMRRYKPSVHAKTSKPSRAVGRYLEMPVLHFTIGTKLTPKMVEEMEEAGHNEILTSSEEPPFTSSMVRIMSATDANPDWFTRLNSTHLKKQLQRAAFSGEDTNIQKNIHFAPRLAVGTNFGDKVKKTGEF